MVFVLLVALFGAACGNKRSASSTPPPATAAVVVPPVVAARTLSPLPSRPLSPKLQALRAQVMRETSAARGLAWRGEVGMIELSGWEYGTRTKELAETLGGGDLAALGDLAVAGGILPVGTDLATLAVSFTAASAGATYSPFDKHVLLLQSDAVKSAAAAPSWSKSLLAHEFVHALQDQHFDLQQLLLARPYNFDRTEAAFALVEGDATNIQRRQEIGEAAWSRRPLAEIARAEDERFGAYRRGLGAFFPALLTETFIFRYRDGARFVETMRRRRPQAVSADDLFRRPPASSEQIIHPEKYLSNETPREVRLDEGAFASAGGWRALASTPLGEIGARGILMAGVSASEAGRASAGWGGDRAWVFGRSAGGEGAPLFVWKTVWDSPGDAREFFRAYNALRRRQQNRAEAETSDAPDAASATWREGNLLTHVRLEGDAVIVVRGDAKDTIQALELARR